MKHNNVNLIQHVLVYRDFKNPSRPPFKKGGVLLFIKEGLGEIKFKEKNNEIYRRA